MTADKTAVPEWIDVAFADGFGWSTYAAHEGDKTRFIRSDLCASGQVRALEWKSHNAKYDGGRSYYGTGIFGHWYGVSRAQNGDWLVMHHVNGRPHHFAPAASLEAAKAAAQADYERHILAALTPAPQTDMGNPMTAGQMRAAVMDGSLTEAQAAEWDAQPEGQARARMVELADVLDQHITDNDLSSHRLLLGGAVYTGPAVDWAHCVLSELRDLLRKYAALTPAPQPEGDHRSFPEAADGRPMPPMGDDLMIAGLNGEDARFVALQLAQNGLMLVSATPTAQEAVPVADGSLICCPRCGCFHERGACVVWG